MAEVVHLAMSVGASRVRVMADAELAKLGSATSATDTPTPVFTAAAIVEQADGG